MHKTAHFHELAQHVLQQQDALAQCSVVGGFDGFVDQLIHIVKERHSQHDYTPIDTMTAFAKNIQAASGRSSLSEIDIQRTDAGGCGVNLCDVYNTMGIPVDYFGTLGQPIHPAFTAFAAACRSCHSWLDGHGSTLALEFNDGKYMLASMNDLHALTPAVLETVLADGAFAAACAQAPLICSCNWALYPHMTDCWKYLQKHIYSKLTHRPFFFFDLVNPSGRSHAEQTQMLETLQEFSAYGNVILGVNCNEAHILAHTLGMVTEHVHTDQKDENDIAEITAALRSTLNIFEVVTHGIRNNCVAGKDYLHDHISGPYCAKPKKSTGAGDRFNAGYCLGHLMNVNPQQRLALGVASSGYFIRNARSPRCTDLAEFLITWGNTKKI